MKAIAKKMRETLLALSLLVFVCRFVIPPGFMPASIEDGGPIVLCPVGMPMDFGAADQPHHHNGGQGSNHSDIAWKNCPFGALLETTALAPNISTTILDPAKDVVPTTEATVIVSSSITVFRARAPPVLDKHA